MKTTIVLAIFALASIFIINKNSFSLTGNYGSDSAEVCIVSGETIEGSGVNIKYLNQNVKFCCEGCVKAFNKNPAKYLGSAALWCPVCDEGDAKKDISTVNDGVKYYFCGQGCKKKFVNDADKYLSNYK